LLGLSCLTRFPLTTLCWCHYEMLWCLPLFHMYFHYSNQVFLSSENKIPSTLLFLCLISPFPMDFPHWLKKGRKMWELDSVLKEVYWG
jgi:hypothetical protein